MTEAELQSFRDIVGGFRRAASEDDQEGRRTVSAALAARTSASLLEEVDRLRNADLETVRRARQLAALAISLAGGDKSAAGRLRGEMAGWWEQLSEAAQDEMRELSADLHRLTGAEREACAGLAEDHEDADPKHSAGEYIAAAIRARSASAAIR
jgi:hypothetical protein